MKADDVLIHFGVQGMKWGVRKDRATAAAKKAIKPSEDYVQSRKLMKARTKKSLSNTELAQLNKRLQLEKSYRELRSDDVNKGLQFVKTVTAAGTTVASFYALSTTPLGQSVIKAIKKGG